MKKIKILAFLMLGLLTVTSCIDDDNDELSGNQNVGGLVTPANAAVGYVVGNDATYTAGGSIYQGNVATTSVGVYKSFTSATTGNSSNEVLMTTIPISETSVGSTATFTFSFTYEDLIAGLTLDGAPISANDADLTIGDFWTLRYAATTTTGQEVFNRSTTKVSVGTRFAGTYNVVEHQYWRIGVRRDDVGWPDTMLIESVDATTYRVVEYFGAFDGNEYYFEIDENDNISYPLTTPSGDPQLGNGQPFITCESHPAEMTHVCSPAIAIVNQVVRDDVDGKDRLYMSFGYLTDNTAGNSREFYQLLEKIVE